MSKLLKSLVLDLGDRSYPIFIGERLLGDNAYFSDLLKSRRVAVISDETVASLYLDRLRAAVPEKEITTVILPPGEASKSFPTLEKLIGRLLESGLDRSSTLVALGGGVIGDVTGFAAACYQRGINFIQVPTSLLAQVDSSVGGKTGINHALGKNMIGAFHQPVGVIIDLDTLRSLPDNQITAGIAEIIKYGLIISEDFFIWLEANVTDLKKLVPQTLAHAIYHSCRIKSEIVAKDEHETHGHRMLLNFGHTFGHAIETGLGYGRWLHGEAVGCGMALALKLSQKRGLISAADTTRVVRLIEQAGLPARLPEALPAERLMALMRHDKKNVEGKHRFILLEKIGKAFVCDDVSAAELREVLDSAR